MSGSVHVLGRYLCSGLTLTCHSSNFHNFTVERSFKDRAASRFMMKMEVSSSWWLTSPQSQC